MDLHHQFEIPAGLERAWDVLMDIPRIAPCMPGAELTEELGDNTYKGNAKVKVGPIQLQFAGQAQITEIDNEAHKAKVVAKGSDAKGRGNAAADVAFALSEAGPDRTKVDVNTTLNLTGSVAQYGRASGLIDEVAKQIIADFVKNLEAELGQDGTAEGAPQPAQAEGQPSAPASPQQQRKTGEAASGLSILFRALASMIRRWLGLSKK